MAVKKFWKEPYIIYLTITAIIALATFFIGHFTQPLAFKIDMNIKEISDIRKSLEERPTKTELKPIIDKIEEDVCEIKATIKDIYGLLLKKHVENKR